MDFIAAVTQARSSYSTALSWFLSSDIRPSGGLASNRRLLLYSLYNSALDRRRVVFLVTTEAEALAALERCRPGLLIVTPRLDQGDGLSLAAGARSVVPDIRTIVLCDAQTDDLAAAGGAPVDAVFCEQELATETQPLRKVVIAISIGRRYRSPMVREAMRQAERQTTLGWHGSPTQLTPREQQLVDLWVEGLGDRDAAERLGLSYATVRSYGRELRRKLGVGSRSQMVLKVIALGLGRLRSS